MSKNLRSHAVISSGTGASDIFMSQLLKVCRVDELQSTLTSSGHWDTGVISHLFT